VIIRNRHLICLGLSALFLLAVGLKNCLAWSSILVLAPRIVIENDTGMLSRSFAENVGEETFHEAVEAFNNEFSFLSGMSLSIQLVKNEKYYSGWDVREKDFLKELLKREGGDFLILGEIELNGRDKIFRMTLWGYDPAVNVSAPIFVPDILLDNLSLLKDLYIQALFETINEHNPIYVTFY